MGWQGTLAQMRIYGTRVALCCTRTRDCRLWKPYAIQDLIKEHDENFLLWGRRPPCPMCGENAHWMASPGPSTPYRPLLPSHEAEATHRAFLKTFGFTKRDVKRIQMMAEACGGFDQPKALDDLDVPYRVGACMAGQEGRSSGRELGQWKGKSLLWWPMNEREEEIWRRMRRVGPKALPSTPPRSGK